MILLSLSTDIDRSLAEMNSQRAPMKKLSSQKPFGIIQGDHFYGASVIEPENFCFVDVSMHNAPVRQNVRFPADLLEIHALNDVWWKTQLAGETGVDNKRNLALRREGLQNHHWFPRGAHFSLDRHELRSE